MRTRIVTATPAAPQTPPPAESKSKSKSTPATKPSGQAAPENEENA